MSDGKYFLDTNVLVYANDKTEAAKQATAVRLIIDGIRSGRVVISTQVLSEFWVTVTQKIQVPLECIGWKVVFIDATQKKVVIVNSLASSDDLSKAFWC